MVINKVDRPSARVLEVEDELFELFDELGASDTQMDYQTIYASGKEGWATAEMPDAGPELEQLANEGTVDPLIDAILE